VFAIDKLLLLAAVLILFGVLSSKLSARLGLPVLVLFLITGMLAGENGIGGLVFSYCVIVHAPLPRMPSAPWLWRLSFLTAACKRPFRP